MVGVGPRDDGLKHDFIKRPDVIAAFTWIVIDAYKAPDVTKAPYVTNRSRTAKPPDLTKASYATKAPDVTNASRTAKVPDVTKTSYATKASRTAKPPDVTKPQI